MRTRLATLLAASVLVLAGCGGDGSDQAGSDDAPSDVPASPSSSAASPSPSADGDALRYVALGDSYTSAPLVPTTDTSDGCLRSSNNYPALVARARPDLALDDVSCAGADSTAMIGVQTIGSQNNAPQFDALTEDTDVVTIGLGGNDFGLFTTLLAQCASSSDTAGSGQPCTDAATGGDQQDLTAIVPRLEARLTAVFTGVRDRVPDATIVAVGYPRLLPDSGRCDQLPVAPGDYEYVRTLTEGLNGAVAKAAAAVGIGFVDVYAASEGHDICSADPWVNGATTVPDQALAFHPFAAEQQAVADLVLAELPPA